MPMQTQRGGGGSFMASIHPQPATRKMWLVSTTPRQIYALERTGTHCTEGCVSLGPI